jgi:hypothetical protein
MTAPSLVESYLPAHRVGRDCRVTCVRNLLEFHGHCHSYATILGLSSNFFFTYRKSYLPRDVLLFPEGGFGDYFWPLSGQRLDAVENLAYLFNAELLTDRRQSPEEALDAIRPYLREGLPVMVALSRCVLQHFLGSTYAFPDYLSGIDFGCHWVVVAGIDDRRGIAWVYETDRLEVIELPLAVLAEARTLGDGEDDCFLQSRNRWAVLVPPAQAPPLAYMMRTALTKVACNMTSSATGAGADAAALPALELFCRELPHWCERDDLPPKKLKATVLMACFNSETLAGGGLGRRNFGMFLRHAARVLREPRLGEAAGSYGEAAALWQQLFGLLERQLFHSAGPATFDIPELHGLLPRLLDSERRGCERLAEWCAA